MKYNIQIKTDGFIKSPYAALHFTTALLNGEPSVSVSVCSSEVVIWKHGT